MVMVMGFSAGRQAASAIGMLAYSDVVFCLPIRMLREGIRPASLGFSVFNRPTA